MAAILARIRSHCAHPFLIRSCVLGKSFQQIRLKTSQKIKPKAAVKSSGSKFIPRALGAKLKGATRAEWNKEALLGRLPPDAGSVRVVDERPVHYLHDILAMLREHNHPDMADDAEGIVQVETELDMRTDKATKFKVNFTKTVMLPHNFSEGKESTVLVFCETDEQKTQAQEAGAVHAGGLDIIKAIEKGEISTYEYNHAVSTPAMIPAVAKIRKILKKKYPDVREGSVGDNVTALVERYRMGQTFSSQMDLGPDSAVVTVKLGPLSMSNEQLRENLVEYFKVIEQQKGYRSKASEYGSFIAQATVSVQGCSEKFYLHLNTAHLDEQGVADWLASDAERREQQRSERAQTGPVITRPLLEEELFWTMSEEEIAQWKTQDWQRRIKEQRKLIDMTEKQRKAHHVQHVEERRRKKEEEEKYEKKLAEVYRQKRLSRLSKAVQQNIDLETQFRKKVHI